MRKRIYTKIKQNMLRKLPFKCPAFTANRKKDAARNVVRLRRSLDDQKLHLPVRLDSGL